MSSWYSNLSLDALVAQLQKANWTYRNTDDVLMTDAEFDAGFEELRRRSPQHPFLRLVGAEAAAEDSTVLLPYVMGSLDKVRAGEGGLERWCKRDIVKGSRGFVVMEKLDGLSALLVVTGTAGKGKTKSHMYLQGDGVKGVDVSPIVGLLNGGGGASSKREPCVVRGELVLPLAHTPEGKIGRSLVNGWVHRQPPPAEDLAKVHFVAYSVLEPAGLTRSQQFEWLRSRGFEVAGMRREAKMSEENAMGSLLHWKSDSLYPIDGIVIGTDTVPLLVGGGEDKNPTDAVAFKAALEDQKREARVLQVEWNVSRQGLYIPRIQIEPVEIGGARIQWLSGHNARAIYESGIGPGARILIRRSGDVIPTVEKVLEEGPGGASMPPAGTWEMDGPWESGRGTHAIFTGAEGAANHEKALLHALQVLEVEGIGPGLVKKLVEGGITSMKKLWETAAGRLGEILGAGRGPQLHVGLRAARGRATMIQLLIASNKMPRSVGERKLRLLFEKEADCRRWNGAMLEGIAGWSSESLGELLKVMPEALAWIDQSFPGSAAPATAATTPVALAGTQEPTKFVVFTNVRDKELEKKLESSGWQIEDSITKKTQVLVVPDGPLKESTKVKKAKDSGGRIKILPISEFRASC